jgi:predicted DNA-binding transcriptional regulator YafY
MRHDKARALLRLAQALAASAEGLTLDDMAREIGVGRRTAERMRDAIAEVFPQLDAEANGPLKRWRIRGGLTALFQQPTPEELVELAKASQALRAAGAAPRAEALESLERKVKSAMRSSALDRVAPDLEALARAEMIAVQAGPRPFEDQALILALRQAVLAMKAVRFTYLGGANPGRQRTVAPLGLMFGRANYLVAAELNQPAPRNWRLDRIRSLEVLDQQAAPPKDFDLQAYADRSFGIFQDEVHDVVLRATPEGAEEARNWRFHPTQQVLDQADGSVLVSFRASGMLELAWHLFTWQQKIEVVAPQALKDTLRDELAKAAAWHARAESR